MNNKLKEYLYNRWLGLGAGVVLMAIGILLVPHARNESGYNLAIALPMCAFILSSIWLLYVSIKAIVQSFLTGDIFKPAPTLKPREYTGVNKPNTIILKAEKEDGQVVPYDIEFAYIEKPIGQRRKLENTGEYFYLNIKEVDSDKLKKVVLPDTVYLNPRKYVIPLTMPANADYWKPVPNPWEKVSTIALIGVILIEFIAGVVWG